MKPELAIKRLEEIEKKRKRSRLGKEFFVLQGERTACEVAIAEILKSWGALFRTHNLVIKQGGYKWVKREDTDA